MIVVLNTPRGPIGISPDAVRAVLPNKADSACTLIFSESHSVEVMGALAKIRSKLNEGLTASAAGGQAAVEAPPPPPQEEPEEAPMRAPRPIAGRPTPPVRPRSSTSR